MLYLRILLPAILLSILAPACKSQCNRSTKINRALLSGTYDFGKSHKYEKRNKKALKKNRDCVKWVKR